MNASFGNKPSDKDEGAAWRELGVRLTEIVDRGAKAVGTGLDKAADALNRAVDEAGDMAARTLAAAPQMLQSEVAQLLDSMAADPRAGRTAMEELLTAAPGVGAAKLYADAWKAYHGGLAAGNEEQTEKARRDCLRACLAGVVDVVAAAGTVLQGSPSISRFLATSSLLHLATMVPALDRALIEPVIDDALKREPVRDMVDSMLKAVAPVEPAQRTEAGPAQA